MNAAWREGVSAEEITPFAREALDLARELKDSVSEVLTLAAYGRIAACTGSADDYVKQVLQAIDLSNIADPGVRTMLQVFLCQACGYAGRLREALQASDTALANIADIKKSHDALLGFNVERWVESLRARLLVRMGNFTAAKQSIVKLTSTEQDHPDPAVQFIPHLAGVELAWLTQDQNLADFHCVRIGEIAASSRIPYVAVYAAVCKALFLSLSGNHVAAIQKLESAIRLATEAYAGMEYQSEMLAFLAEIHLRSNSPTAAFRVAERGMAVARERHARLAECRSTIILALVLSEGKLSHPDYQASELLARARRLIEETGALPYESLLAAAQPSAVSCGSAA
jgi:adenylate cyclase